MYFYYRRMSHIVPYDCEHKLQYDVVKRIRTRYLDVVLLARLREHLTTLHARMDETNKAI